MHPDGLTLSTPNAGHATSFRGRLSSHRHPALRKRFVREKRELCGGACARGECWNEAARAGNVFGGRKLQRETEARGFGSFCLEEEGSGSNCRKAGGTRSFSE